MGEGGQEGNLGADTADGDDCQKAQHDEHNRLGNTQNGFVRGVGIDTSLVKIVRRSRAHNQDHTVQSRHRGRNHSCHDQALCPVGHQLCDHIGKHRVRRLQQGVAIQCARDGAVAIRCIEDKQHQENHNDDGGLNHTFILHGKAFLQ